MGAVSKARKSEGGEPVSDASEGGSGGQKQQSAEPGCFSPKPGILPLPARDFWPRFQQLPSENKPGSVLRTRLPACCWNTARPSQQVSQRMNSGRTSSDHIPDAEYSRVDSITVKPVITSKHRRLMASNRVRHNFSIRVRLGHHFNL